MLEFCIAVSIVLGTYGLALFLERAGKAMLRNATARKIDAQTRAADAAFARGDSQDAEVE